MILTVTCGHTTQTLRCIYYGVPSDHEVLAPEGHLSITVLREKQASYAEAVDKGIEYDVIAWEVEAVLPDIVDLFQEAGNQQKLAHDWRVPLGANAQNARKREAAACVRETWSVGR